MQKDNDTAETLRPFARQTARLVTQEEQQKLGLSAETINNHSVLTTPFPEAP